MGGSERGRGGAGGRRGGVQLFSPASSRDEECRLRCFLKDLPASGCKITNKRAQRPLKPDILPAAFYRGFYYFNLPTITRRRHNDAVR